jgi:hypothetical protein
MIVRWRFLYDEVELVVIKNTLHNMIISTSIVIL